MEGRNNIVVVSVGGVQGGLGFFRDFWDDWLRMDGTFAVVGFAVSLAAVGVVLVIGGMGIGTVSRSVFSAGVFAAPTSVNRGMRRVFCLIAGFDVGGVVVEGSGASFVVVFRGKFKRNAGGVTRATYLYGEDPFHYCGWSFR